MIGTNNAGSIFNVLQSFIFKILIPELAIKTPPIIESSVIKASEKKEPDKKWAIRKILPCHISKIGAANNIPIPYVDANIIDVTKSKV